MKNDVFRFLSMDHLESSPICRRRVMRPPWFLPFGVWLLSVAAIVASLIAPHTAGAADAGAPTDWGAFFDQSTGDRLIKRLETNEPAVSPLDGLQLIQQPQWRPSVNTLAVTNDLKNTGQSPASAEGIRIADLTFRVRPRKEDTYYDRLAYRNDEWYESTYWTGPDWTRVGKNWHHPGESMPSVRCFRVPREGRVTIRGRIFKLHQEGDGVRVEIRHGLKRVWRAEIDGPDGEGVEPEVTLDVRRGDRLRFVVQKRGDHYCDTTGWDPIVAYEGGESFQASASFSTHEQGTGGWFYEMENAEPLAEPYEVLKYDTRTWYESTFWTGPDWTRVGKNWHHPGENTPSVRRFRVPRDGRVTITGRVFKLHQQGDGVRALIQHGEHGVWRAEIEGADGQGVEPNVTLDVRQGDAIRFIVDKRGAISCDTTGWDPVVTYKDGQAFQASASFSPKQGTGGWFYEMVSDGRTEPTTTATLYVFGKDWVQRTVSMMSTTPYVVTDEEALPVFVVADGLTESGVLVAIDGSVPWSGQVGLTQDGRLRLTVTARFENDERLLKPGGTVKLPSVLLTPYEGPWTASFSTIQALADRNDSSAVPTETLGTTLQAAHATATAGMDRAPELALLLMAQAEWRLDDAIEETVESYKTAVADHLERSVALLADLKAGQKDGGLAKQTQRLRELAKRAGGEDQQLDGWRQLYVQTRLLKRDILLGNPLLDFGNLLFCKRVPPSYSHLVGQYYGWRQRPGGGLFILERSGVSLRCRDILNGQLPPGSVLEPSLSYDAARIVFSYVASPAEGYDPNKLSVNEEGEDDGYLHVYEINVDGTGLRQLTSGLYDDMMPVYLPDGGIAFTSTRRRSYSRCFGSQFSERWDSYTLHRMNADGGHIHILSVNDVSEWFPAVATTGHLLFARWDYIDRDAVTHQNLWAMRPDGSNPTAVWGNATPKPHCTFQAKSIPGSNKIVFIASAHHAMTAGPVCVVDPAVDANSQEAITRITSGPYPEAESNQIPEYYNAPWPLSEECFLVAYSRDRLRFEGEHMRDPNPDNSLGLFVIDAAGNRELVYRDPAIGSTNPIPLVPRGKPPVLSNTLATDDSAMGEMIVTDVYQGLGDVPRGTIKELRIVQVFPKTTPWANNPRIGLAGEENSRAILGTVPIEADGSARFLLPAHKPVLFQALDENGFAYQTMRSSTYVQPGERTACIGCHEHRASAPPNVAQVPLALLRPPSALDPGELGGRPFSFVQAVQPLLDNRCVKCHGGEKTEGEVDLRGTPHEGFTTSYWSLCKSPANWQQVRGNSELAAAALVPRYYQRNQVQATPPGGKYGARGSRLMKLLMEDHEGVKLNRDELRRLATWIDLNAVFHGVYDAEGRERELRGERVAMPEIQ